jgi:hypothetical protein
MNVSLSPNETLGRMLHSFSANAYEIAEYTHKNLVKHNIIKDNLLVGIDKITHRADRNISLSDLSGTENYLEKHNISNATGIKFYDIAPNTSVEINGSSVDVYNSNNFENIPIYSLKGLTAYTSGGFILFFEED